MRVTSVNYKKIFPGEIQFTNTTLGVEIEVNENENAHDAFDLAKKTIEEWVNPQKAVAPITPVPLKWHELPVIDRQYEKIEIAIDNAQTIAELNALSKEGLPLSLMTMFNQKVKELQKQ